MKILLLTLSFLLCGCLQPGQRIDWSGVAATIGQESSNYVARQQAIYDRTWNQYYQNQQLWQMQQMNNNLQQLQWR